MKKHDAGMYVYKSPSFPLPVSKVLLLSLLFTRVCLLITF